MEAVIDRPSLDAGMMRQHSSLSDKAGLKLLLFVPSPFLNRFSDKTTIAFSLFASAKKDLILST
jgi:hypothetical protein